MQSAGTRLAPVGVASYGEQNRRSCFSAGKNRCQTNEEEGRDEVMLIVEITGFAIAFIAIIADRLIFAAARKARLRLGLAGDA